MADLSQSHAFEERMLEAEENEGTGLTVLALIRHAFDPVRQFGNRHDVARTRLRLNTILALQGLEVREAGQVCPVRGATHSDASRIPVCACGAV